MKTEIVRSAAKQTKREYPCVMEYDFPDTCQELVILFTSSTKGIVLHTKNTGWKVGEEAFTQNPEHYTWLPFRGSIKFHDGESL